ncbi:40S ribosomal protein S29 [Camellia lanceoleosa]|nr:40S ribosomal protein S29 [Camellia lanceoleosa]
MQSYGKVKVVVLDTRKSGCVFHASQWPNMLKILNRLNGLKVDDCRIIAHQRSVFPPEHELPSLTEDCRSNVCSTCASAGSLLDIIRNAYDLLSHRDIKIPKVIDEEKTIGLIRKYGLMCYRQCFRSNAKEIGFIKYR